MTPEEYINTEVEPGSELPDIMPEAKIADSIEVTPLKGSFRHLGSRTQQLIWVGFGVLAILAIIIPGTYIYIKNAGTPAPSTDVVIVPVINDGSDGSTDATKTVQPATPKPEKLAEKNVLGEEFEDWDYKSLGRNILAPLKGKRVMDYVRELNPEFEGVYLDALDLEVHTAEVAELGALPIISGRTPTSPMPDDGSAPSTTFTAIKLTGIGTSNGSRVAVFLVNGTTYEAGVGDEIDSLGWSVTSISSSTVVITDGTSSRTLVLPNGSK